MAKWWILRNLKNEFNLLKKRSQGIWVIRQKFGYWKQGIRTFNRNFDRSKWVECITALLHLNVRIEKLDQVNSVVLSKLEKKNIETLRSAGVKGRFAREALITWSEKSSTMFMSHYQIIYLILSFEQV